MNKIELGEFIKSTDKDLEIKEGNQFTEVTVPPLKLFSLAKQLKESEEVKFDFLVCISGIDYGADLGVVYHTIMLPDGEDIPEHTHQQGSHGQPL